MVLFLCLLICRMDVFLLDVFYVSFSKDVKKSIQISEIL